MPRRPMPPGLAVRRRLPAGLGMALLLGVLGLGAGHAGARPPDAKPASAAPAGSVRFTRSYGWAPLEARRLVLWAGVEEPYLVDLSPGCADLRKARVSGFTTHDRRLVPHTDSLAVDGVACPVDRIQPASGSTLRALGVRREDAQPLPIVPITAPRKMP